MRALVSCEYEQFLATTGPLQNAIFPNPLISPSPTFNISAMLSSKPVQEAMKSHSSLGTSCECTGDMHRCGSTKYLPVRVVTPKAVRVGREDGSQYHVAN